MPGTRGKFELAFRAEKGDVVMQAFDHTEFESYKAEAGQRWGSTDAYKEHAEKTGYYSKEKWEELAAGMDAILAEFARCRDTGAGPGSAGAQELVNRLQDYITEHYYRCTKQILAGLGQMYVADERFQTNIDRHGEGTAAFLSRAIELYCAN